MLITTSEEQEPTRNYIQLDTPMYNKCVIEYLMKMMGHLVSLHSKYIPFKEVHFN